MRLIVLLLVLRLTAVPSPVVPQLLILPIAIPPLIVMVPTVLEHVVSPKAQQLAARPWPPCPWAGLGEPARPHIALVILPALPVLSRPHKTWGGASVVEAAMTVSRCDRGHEQRQVIF